MKQGLPNPANPVRLLMGSDGLCGPATATTLATTLLLLPDPVNPCYGSMVPHGSRVPRLLVRLLLLLLLQLLLRLLQQRL